MKELSLNILDIAQNSVKAGAKNIAVAVDETDTSLTFSVTDDGCGMTPEFLARVTDPFTTTRTTRKVGLGLPLLKMEAEQSGGHMNITSVTSEFPNHGTVVTAVFMKNNIDFTPLGDIIGTVCVLIQGAGNIDFSFTHSFPSSDGTKTETVSLDTREMRTMLEGVPLDTPEVVAWVGEYLKDSYKAADYSGSV